MHDREPYIYIYITQSVSFVLSFLKKYTSLTKTVSQLCPYFPLNMYMQKAMLSEINSLSDLRPKLYI